MTRNALKFAILLDAMTAIMPNFETDVGGQGSRASTFKVEFISRSCGRGEGAASGEIRVFDDAANAEKFTVAATSLLAAREALQGEGGDLTRPDSACTATDLDGDELIAVFSSRDPSAAAQGFDRGTYAVLGGTGKFKGLAATGAYACSADLTSRAAFSAMFSLEVMRKPCSRGTQSSVSEASYSPMAA